VQRDERELILSATERLLKAIVAENSLDSTQVASALFSSTPDLTAASPAAAAVRIGWIFVPVFSFAEIQVAGGLSRCVKVLVHFTTDVRQDRIAHVFLDGANTSHTSPVVRSRVHFKPRDNIIRSL
jgi:chorismate mutase